LRFPEFTEEWQEHKLCNIASIVGRIGFRGYTTNDIVAKGKGAIALSPTNIENNRLTYDKDNTYISFYKYEESPEIMIKQGDVVFVKTGSTVGKVAYVDKLMCKTTLNPQVIVLKNIQCDNYLLSVLMSTSRFQNAIRKITVGGAVPTLSQAAMGDIAVTMPQVAEQEKLSKFISLLDKRIATQNKIIEDLKKLKSAIIEMEYGQMAKSISHIGDFIEQISKRNKDSAIKNVLSVSNSQGFIQQSEQFENRIVASDDTSNYKIVERNDFAFNPARINVGSIARLTTFERGIVSPMYICFRTKDILFPEYLDYYFESKQFFTEIQKRLEGSVRQCLSFDGLCNIPLCVPAIEMQQQIGKRLSALVQEIKLEIDFLELLHKQKKFLLYQMFI
jgi:type I restriction enzyme S subunit